MRPNQKLMQINTHAAELYHQALAGSPGEAYLESRGLAGAAERFKLGWVAEPAPGHPDRLIHTIAIPYLTQAGVVGFKFRRLDSDRKYDQLDGQKQHVYNVQAIIDAVSEVLIVEGELDAIAATLAGKPACAIAGANGWKPKWRRLFDGIGVVKIVTDNDVKDSGANPGQELARAIFDSLPNGVRVSLPPGHDVNSMLQAYGAQTFTDLVESI